MAQGKDLIELALKHIGDKYRLGVIAPKDDSDYNGPWDCAEFASWVVYQCTQKLYGCANNCGNPKGADAYSGFWARDATKVGILVSIEEATKIKGAFLIRVAGDGLIGHVAISQGNGKTVEAHSTKTGVIESVVSGRRWDYGVVIPWIDYTETDNDVVVNPPKSKIYRYTNPLMHDEFIKKIQKAVGIKLSNCDGWYGSETFNAVKAFQYKKGLVPDGEAGPMTLKALKLI